ncbi:hypothetical protein B0H67DRAFT_561219 [Lasiosphaeris hirsuta]|uniref:F-box domain-containing protein n=1 Tax=Lasiosphaeris hirsuta TaxID=260670 RepID=A0AA40B9N7_9PEZI|nr:hypothetical protein B0H67DRAFT_561219 [Lasiosphaeris hirsuta]
MVVVSASSRARHVCTATPRRPQRPNIFPPPTLLPRSCNLEHSQRGRFFSKLTMSAIAHQVASTPELLEMILLELDMRTLITSAQRVDRNWSQTIKASPRLQQALYFAPARKPRSRATQTPPYTQNPLLAEVFSPFFSKPPRRTDTTWPGFYRRLALAKKTRGKKKNSKAERPRQAAFMRADASWRHMLVTQPPIAKLAVVTVHDISGGRYFGTAWEAGEVKFTTARSRPRGLTMGVLYDMAFDWVHETRPDCAVQVLWRTQAATEETGEETPKPRRMLQKSIRGWSGFHKDSGIEGWDDQQVRLNGFEGILNGFDQNVGAVLRLYSGTRKRMPGEDDEGDGLSGCKSLGYKHVAVELRSVLEQFTA